MTALSSRRTRAPADGATPRRRRAQRFHGREVATAYLFIAPAIALFALMGVYTLAYGLALSGASWNGFSPHWTWVGLNNYRDLLFHSPIYAPIIRAAALHTLFVMIAVPALTVAISFPLAILLNNARRFGGLLRTIFFLPYVTAGIAVYLAWQFILQPDGAINFGLKSLGWGSLSQPQGFLGNPATALPALIVVMVWSSVPVGMLLYVTGLQTLDTNVLEAAQIDGAGWWRSNTRVVWPLLRPITAAVIMLNLREALQGFQTFLVIAGPEGSPGGRTNVLGLEAYHLAFLENLQPTLGLASALGWLMFIVALVLALLNLRVLRSAT